MSIVLAARRDTQHVETPRKAALKSNTPRRQTALSSGQKESEAKAAHLLMAQHASGVPDAEAAGILIAQAAAMYALQTRTAAEQLTHRARSLKAQEFLTTRSRRIFNEIQPIFLTLPFHLPKFSHRDDELLCFREWTESWMDGLYGDSDFIALT
jgi:hypothetical protein